MIVITSLNRTTKYLFPFDRFQLRITDGVGCTVMIDEEVTVERKVDFIASYRFAREDGTCEGFNLCGVFAESATLPKELREAVMFDDLTPLQKANFVAGCGTKVAT